MAQEFSESESLNPDENVDVSINDLYEQASELSEDIKEQEGQDLQEFQKKAEMAYSKMKRAVKSLREAADELDQKCRDCQMAHAVGTAGGVLSGLITLGATVMTAGAASPLLLATGMGFGLGGAAINLGSSSIESAANSVKVKRAQKHLKEASDCVNEVNAVIKDWLNTKEKARLVYICCLAAELKFGPFVMKLLNQVMSVCLRSISTLKVKTAGMLVTLTSAFAVEGSKAAVKSVEKATGAAGQACAQVADDIAQATAGAVGAAGQACAQVADDVAQATAGAAGAVGQASAQVADDVAQATGAAGAAGQAGGKVGEYVSREVLFGVNVAFLTVDALDLIFTIRDIWKNKGSETAKHLREKANELEATMKQ